MSALALTAGMLTGCNDDIDNALSRNQSVIQLQTSSDYVVLDESRPDDVALTIEWDAAHDYGNEYLTTYTYEYSAVGSKAPTKKEYEDDGIFRRDTYTGLNWSEVPSILVEMGFMTNEEEDYKLNDPAYQQLLVQGMVEGICAYMGR